MSLTKFHTRIGKDLVDDSTTELENGRIIVKDSGITTDKLNDSAVTKEKMENMSGMTVLGNITGVASSPDEIDIIDDDTMSTASANNLATAESIKAYVDAKPYVTTESAQLTTNGYQILPSGLIMQWGRTTGKPFTASYVQVPITFPIPFPNACLNIQATGDVGGATNVAVAVPEIFSYNKTSMVLIDGDNDGTDWDAHWYAIGY